MGYGSTHPLRITSLFSIVCGSQGPGGFHSQVFGEPIHKVGVLKLGHQMWGLNSSIFGEKLGIGGSLPIVWHYARGGDNGENVSSLPYSFRCGYFLIC